ncbi:MAG TPA: hypothetical protein VM370_11405 [Candidatus Thermoplasmatota archaeon]|nr:hypothetical protein [Candidatus Thermoplasmatota archaeon]
MSSILVLVPLGVAANDCDNLINTANQHICVAIPAGRPASPSPLPAVPNSGLFGTYYLFVAGNQCTNVASDGCRGLPASPGSGIPNPTPDGGTLVPSLSVWGLLWQESNQLSGLQRKGISSGGVFHPADHIVLV